ncbi:MAG: hypothetical protein AAFQ14_09105 [Cyanobacteria bacterium J06621_12]
MSLPLAFIICTEPGRLEKQSQILAKSIRTFGGKLKDTPIYSFHPRQGTPVADETLAGFAALGVEHQQVVLNVKYHDYYLANKPYVCAYAEETIDAEILVFLDSDKCFFAEPTEFLLPSDYNIGLRVEYGRGIGSTGSQDIQDDYWQKLYQTVGVEEERFVSTPIGNKKIRAYWNSGMVATRSSAGIFQAWKHNFEQVMAAEIVPKQGNYMIEQSSLSATVCALKEEVFTFSSSYSYPLPLHNRLSPEFQLASFDEIVSIHYFGMFYYRNWQKELNQLKQIDKKSSKYNWLRQTIIDYDLDYKPITTKYYYLLKKIEKRMRQFNVKINLSELIKPENS